MSNAQKGKIMGKKSNSTTSKTVYGNTTTTNPYVTSHTTNNGTATVFNKGTAFDTINNFVNNNMGSILDSYINPNLNTVTNKAKMNAFINNLNAESNKSFENNIINPLSARNMVRSSQATNMYNNLAAQNTSNIANFTNDLLANSQADAESMLKTLLYAYISGYNTLASTQAQSLQASQGNSTSTQIGKTSGMDTSDMMNIALQVALLAAGI